jgi:tellurite methyltransferase
MIGKPSRKNIGGHLDGGHKPTGGKNPNINVICTDLDTWIIPQNRYDLFVNMRFLDRRLFPLIQNGLKPGGTQIFGSFVDRENDKYGLIQNELLRAFQSFRIVNYEEKRADPSEKFNQIPDE